MLSTNVLMGSMLMLLGSPAGAWAAGLVIGLAVSSGRMEVDRAAVDSNASLSEGSLVKTTNAPARLQLNNGARLTLAPSASATVYSDRVVLESGAALLNQHPRLPLEAGEFQIRATEPLAQALVERRADGVTEVVAMEASVQVLDRHGLLLARVSPGKPLTFEAAADGAPAASQVRGILLQQQGRFVLHDDLTQLQVEVAGDNLDRFLNRRIEVMGTVEKGSGTEAQRIIVSRLNLANDNPREPEQAGPGAPKKGLPANQTAIGLSHGAKIGIGLGVAAGIGLGAGIPLATISR